jgi:hypothetical protein
MVKFRGIEISIVSQFDIRKLPEFKMADKSREDPFTERDVSKDSQAVASCFIPIYAGSQSKSHVSVASGEALTAASLVRVCCRWTSPTWSWLPL